MVVLARVLRLAAAAELVGLVAGADLDVVVALLALHEAAPVELALAPLNPPLLPRREPSVAAHHSAPVQAVALLKKEEIQKLQPSSVSAKLRKVLQKVSYD